LCGHAASRVGGGVEQSSLCSVFLFKQNSARFLAPPSPRFASHPLTLSLNEDEFLRFSFDITANALK